MAVNITTALVLSMAVSSFLSASADDQASAPSLSSFMSSGAAASGAHERLTQATTQDQASGEAQKEHDREARELYVRCSTLLELVSGKVAHINNVIKTLQQEQVVRADDLVARRAEQEQLQQQVILLAASRDSLAEMVREQEAQITQLTGNISVLSAQNVAERSRIDALKQEYAATYMNPTDAHNIAELQIAIQGYKNAKRDLESQLKIAQDHERTLNNEVVALQHNYSQLKQRLTYKQVAAEAEVVRLYNNAKTLPEPDVVVLFAQALPDDCKKALAYALQKHDHATALRIAGIISGPKKTFLERYGTPGAFLSGIIVVIVGFWNR